MLQYVYEQSEDRNQNIEDNLWWAHKTAEQLFGIGLKTI